MTQEEKNSHKVKLYKFKKELKAILIEHRMDKASGVPAQVLADFLLNQIIAIGRLQDGLDNYRNPI